MTQTTILLVDAEGESMRRRVKSPQVVTSLARKLHIPCYDINRVGYPQRMRDYNLRQKRAENTTTRAGSSTSRARTTSRDASERARTERTQTRRQDHSRRAQQETPPRRAPHEQRAITVLESAAGVRLSAGAEDRELQTLLRKARAAAHPDRHGGDRRMWDRVEEAARTLGLD